MNIVCKLNNVIQANEKALFTPDEQILKGQREYYRHAAVYPEVSGKIPPRRDNLELDEHKYLLQVEPARRSLDEGGSETSNLSAEVDLQTKEGSEAEPDHSISDADKLLNSYSLLLNSEVIAIDPNYYRPTEVDLLIGDPSKAKKKLDWQAETKIDELVRIMVESDFKKVVEKGY